ncbi:MAG: response regulator, partial [Chloroflexota bacterium]
LGLNWQSGIGLDVQVLDNAFFVARLVDLMASPAQISQWIALLQPATAVYRGDFLEGFSLEGTPEFDNWASLQREACHRRVRLIFDRLAQLQYENGDLIGAIETTTQWIRHDSLNEAAYSYLMHLHLENGDPYAGRQVYHACCIVLEREFKAKPSPQTQTLAERLSHVPILAEPPRPSLVLAPDRVELQSPVEPPHHILIVDDDEDILETLSNQLTHIGYRVTTLSQPKESLSWLKQDHYDLLITDAMMPGFSGYDLVRSLRAIPALRNLAVIMLTSLGSREDALQAFRDGVDDFLSKPWKVEILRSKIRRLLERDNSSGEKLPPPPSIGQHHPTASSGLLALDQALGGSWPIGSNLLVLGNWGSGKSTFAQHFMAEGIVQGEPGLWINFDESPERVLHQLDLLTGGLLDDYNQYQKFRVVDGAEWSLAPLPTSELNVNWEALANLTKTIIAAGVDLGQTAQQQAGGRRVLDSISTLLLQFDLTLVQRFLLQLARTAQSYGRVSTLFLLEQEAVEEQLVNQIKFFMDGILEVRHRQNYEMRVVNHRWQTYSTDWFEVKYYFD